MKSQWLAQNEAALAQMKHRLTEFELQGSYSELPLRELIGLLNGSENEVRRIDAELEQVATALTNLQKTQLPETKDETKKANKIG